MIIWTRIWQAANTSWQPGILQRKKKKKKQHKKQGYSIRADRGMSDVCKMWYFTAIYLDYNSQAKKNFKKRKKSQRRSIYWAWLHSIPAATLSCTIFSKSTSNLFCSVLQMSLSRMGWERRWGSGGGGVMGFSSDRHTRLNTWYFTLVMRCEQIIRVPH